MSDGARVDDLWTARPRRSSWRTPAVVGAVVVRVMSNRDIVERSCRVDVGAAIVSIR